MDRKLVLVLALTLLIGMLNVASNVQKAKASGTIYIRADGSIDPPTAPIQRDGNVYNFIDNVYDSIVVERNNVVIDGNGFTLQGSDEYLSNGMDLSARENVTVLGTQIKAFYHGIYGYSSSYSSLCGNNITNNYNGIEFSSSSNNNVSGNNIAANSEHGLRLYYSSSYNTISGNNITAHLGFGIDLEISCNYNSISGNNITNSGNGIQLGSSFNNSVSGNNITNSGWGLRLYYSSNYNSISGNNITNSQYGIVHDGSSNNSISGNSVTDNINGIMIRSSYNSSISGNNIANNDFGIWLESSSDNRFWHNSFDNNAQQVYINEFVHNFWDDGSEGNYWSNYTGVDSNHDGIGDTAHSIYIYNTDRYPLMGIFSDFHATSEYHVQTICNSTISDFQFDGTAIRFYATGENGTTGFCRICIPTALMGGTYRVYVNGTEVFSNLLSCSNSTHSYLYFNYTHSTEEVIIIPEFPSFLILLLFMTPTLSTLKVCRRKRR